MSGENITNFKLQQALRFNFPQTGIFINNTDKNGNPIEPQISKAYTLKQIRSTMASFQINTLQMDIYTVQKLLDHANIKVTDKHYVSFQLNNAYKLLSEITCDKFGQNLRQKKEANSD